MSTHSATPPSFNIIWTATALTTDWLGYKIYRRLSTLPYEDWVCIGSITTDAEVGTLTATNAETYRAQFTDYTAGWAPNYYDYYVAVVHADNSESVVGSSVEYPAYVAADGAVAHWRLGETSGTTAADATGNGRTLTYNGTPQLANKSLISGDSTAGAYFDDASSTYASRAYTAALNAKI